MAQMISIKRVRVGLENLTARVRIVEGAPLMTSEDLVATSRIYYLMPHITEHVCMGDREETFKGVMGDTEIAHLLEHMTVELLSQSSESAEIISGRTFPVEEDDRSFDIELSCPDDVLVMGALSSAVWIANWAFGGGGDPVPDVEAIVAGLTSMVQNIGEIHEVTYRQQVEDELRAEVTAEYQRKLQEREEQIAEREEQIAEARAKVQAEAMALEEADRKAAEEEIRRREEEAEAARRAAMPSWAVDLDEISRQDEERRRAQAEAAAVQTEEVTATAEPAAAEVAPSLEDDQSMEETTVSYIDGTEAAEVAAAEEKEAEEKAASRESEDIEEAAEESVFESKGKAVAKDEPAEELSESELLDKEYSENPDDAFASEPVVEPVKPDERVEYLGPDAKVDPEQKEAEENERNAQQIQDRTGQYKDNQDALAEARAQGEDGEEPVEDEASKVRHYEDGLPEDEPQKSESAPVHEEYIPGPRRVR